MKKIGLSIGVSLILALSIVACNKQDNALKVNNDTSQTEEDSLKNTEESSSLKQEEVTTEKVTEPPTIGDVEPPVISGAKDIAIEVGEAISYKSGVSVSDNIDEEVELVIDKEQVDTTKAGTYKVYYMATDSAGNEAIREVTVTVNEKFVLEDEVIEMADEIIASLITDDMTDWQKAYKLWNWCRTKIIYSTKAGDRTSKYTGAYEALKNRSGDCFVYYATYSVFLDRIGIENIKVARINGKSNHWWNLVNLGDGWYHCDSSPRTLGDLYMCFMQTDAQLAAYTDAYTLAHPEKPNYFTFDTTLYPERETEIVYSGYPE